MPAQFLMSWEYRNCRWWKQYKGRRYLVSCRQLGAPPTKLGSYRQANSWWLAKRAEIDGTLTPADITDRFPTLDPAAVLRYMQAQISESPPSPYRDMVLGDLDALAHPDQPQPDPTPPDRSLGHLVDRYLDHLRVLVAADQLSSGEVANRRYHLEVFTSHLGEPFEVNALDEPTWRRWFEHVVSGSWSQQYKRKLLSTSRAFIDFLVEERILPEPPRNYRKQKLRTEHREIQVFTVAELRSILAQVELTTLELYTLLALNTGMTQADISDLSPGEIDTERGTITRRRSKTSHHPSAPRVTYSLWPETKLLLSLYRSSSPDHVLLSPHGKPLVVRTESTFYDLVKTRWERLSPKPRLSFKHLRKSGSTILRSHPTHGQFSRLYLGHAPDSVEDIHYSKYPQGLFDQALAWLRSQILGQPAD